MIITIEKNIPIPEAKGGVRKYPFLEMEVGGSFSIPLSGKRYRSTGQDKAISKVSSAAVRAEKRTGREFTVRTLGDEGVVRCWRVK